MANIVELREMSQEKLQEALEDAREEMFNLRFQRATGTLEDYSRLSKTRREIAQIATVLNGRQKAIDYAAKEPAIAKVLVGKTWTAVATFDYENSNYLVEFSDADNNELTTARVDINKKRRGVREARKTKSAPHRVVSYEISG